MSLKTAIIVVDIINDFVTGVLGSKRAQRIIPRVKHLIDFAHDGSVTSPSVPESVTFRLLIF